MAYIGVSPSNGVRRKHTYTATAAQTSFTGAGAEGITLSYLDSNYVDVYQNGVKLSEADYTSTTGTTVVLATGAIVSDMVEIVVYDVFSVADTVSKSAGGTFDGDVTAAGTLAVTGVVTANGGAVFNEGSADVDFRVESNGNANMLFVDGGNDRVYIGKNATGSTFNAKLQIEDTGAAAGIAIHRANAGTGQGNLNFSKSRAATIGDNTVVQDGDGLGAIIWSGADGTDRATPAAQIQAVVDGTPGSNDMPGKLIFSTTKDGAAATSEYFRLMSNGRLEAQSVSNDGTVLQQFRIDWRNENNAGIMAGIGCVRTDNSNAPGAFVIRTSTNVDSSANSSDGEISEKFRVAANGDLTGTDTSIASNSDNRLKENISDFTYNLTKFKALKTKTFDWKQPTLHGNKSGVRGFVAQDIETVDNYWIDEVEVQADSDDYQYLEDKDVLYTENSTIPEGKEVGDLEYKARMAKTSKLGQKDAMYVSIIQQLITKIETLETKVTALEG